MGISVLLLIPILLPVIAGVFLLRTNIENRAARERYVSTAVIINAAITIALVFAAQGQTLTLFSFGENLNVALKIDTLSAVFASLVSVLWILACFYAFEYMKHEGMEVRFLSFYIMTLGITLGIAFSANLVTLYLFYELLTLVTLPLVTHSGTPAAMTAGRMYFMYSIAGAAAGLMAIAGVYYAAGTTDFVVGGLMNAGMELAPVMLTMYIVGFLGFGVKAAVFPLHSWLPVASVAPTPVTALLHAVAVVKAGVFAITRLTYFSFGADFLRGTSAQTVVMLVCIATILFGSSMAVKTKHLKRRLAYSTVSQLSYILLGIVMMSPEGLVSGGLHLIVHAVAKITLFYCAGAILYKTGREYVWELHGIAKKMPITMAAFTISSLALTGIPPFSGFFSKWQLITAAIGSHRVLGYIGAAALILSAFLTAAYLLSICLPAYLPPSGYDAETANQGVADPNRYMTVPLMILSAFTVLFGLFYQPLMSIFQSVLGG